MLIQSGFKMFGLHLLLMFVLFWESVTCFELTMDSSSRKVHIKGDDDEGFPAVNQFIEESNSKQMRKKFVIEPLNQNVKIPIRDQPSKSSSNFPAVNSLYAHGLSKQHGFQNVMAPKMPVENKAVRLDSPPAVPPNSNGRWRWMYGTPLVTRDIEIRKLNDYAAPVMDDENNNVDENFKHHVIHVALSQEDMNKLMEHVDPPEDNAPEVHKTLNHMAPHAKQWGVTYMYPENYVPMYKKYWNGKTKRLMKNKSFYGMFKPEKSWKQKRQERRRSRRSVYEPSTPSELPESKSNSHNVDGNVYHSNPAYPKHPNEVGTRSYPPSYFTDSRYSESYPYSAKKNYKLSQPYNYKSSDRSYTPSYSSTYSSPSYASSQSYSSPSPSKYSYSSPPSYSSRSYSPTPSSSRAASYPDPWKTIVKNPDHKIWIGEDPDGNNKWWVQMKPLEIDSYSRSSPDEQKLRYSSPYNNEPSVNSVHKKQQYWKSLPKQSASPYSNPTDTRRQGRNWEKAPAPSYGSHLGRSPWQTDSTSDASRSTGAYYGGADQGAATPGTSSWGRSSTGSPSWTPTHNFIGNQVHSMNDNPNNFLDERDYPSSLRVGKRVDPLKEFDEAYFAKMDQLVKGPSENIAKEGPDDQAFSAPYSNQYNEIPGSASQQYPSSHEPQAMAYKPQQYRGSYGSPNYNYDVPHRHGSLDHAHRYGESPHSHHSTYVHPPPLLPLPRSRFARSTPGPTPGPYENSPYNAILFNIPKKASAPVLKRKQSSMKKSGAHVALQKISKNRKRSKRDLSGLTYQSATPDNLLYLDDYGYDGSSPQQSGYYPNQAGQSYSGYVQPAPAPSVAPYSSPEQHAYSDYSSYNSAPKYQSYDYNPGVEAKQAPYVTPKPEAKSGYGHGHGGGYGHDSHGGGYGHGSHGGGYGHDSHGGGYGHDSHGGGYGHNSHGGGYGHDSHGGGYGHDSHGGGYGHDSHGGGYGHDSHGGGYGHDDHHGGNYGKTKKWDKGHYSRGYGKYGQQGDNGAYHSGNVKGKWHVKKNDDYKTKGSKVKTYSYGGKGWYKEESHGDNHGYGAEHGQRQDYHQGDHKQKTHASKKPYHQYNTKLSGYHKEHGYH